MQIGTNIRKIRESKNITIDKIVKDLNIFKEKYIRIENNSVKPTAIILRKISRFFNVSEKDIINYNEESEKIDKINVQKLELKNLTFKSERREVEEKFTVGKLIALKPQLLNSFELDLIKNKPNIKNVIDVKPSESMEVLDEEFEIDENEELDDIDPFEGLDFKRGTPFSPRLLNCVESYIFNGFKKTLFYTEVNSGLKVGDRVFILNGNYDSNFLIKENKYKIGTDGYKVLFVDKCRIVLDIDFTGVLPFQDDETDQFINVYYVKNLEDFVYVNRQFTTRGNNFDYKFNQFQNNIIYVDDDYAPISDWGETLGLTGSPGFFVKNGTASWINITPDFINGSYSVALSPTYSNNNRVKINWGSFTYSIGSDVVEFTEGFSYKWSVDSKFDLNIGTYSTWEIDSKYSQPIITKGNFRRGNFKGKFNSGVFGSTDEKIEWNNATFNSGTVFNAKWLNGEINSIYTLRESYISEFDENNPFQKIVEPNNNGYGYNFFIDSEITSSIINNANIYNTVIGNVPTYSIVEDHILNNQINYTNKINKGSLNFVKLIGAIGKNIDIKNSKILCSKVEDSRSINSSFNSSVFSNSVYISDDSIKILDYSEYNFSISTGGITHKLYRFYISRQSYERLKIRDGFYIKGLKINDGIKYPLNFFDKRFRLSSWTEYIDDYNNDNFYKRGYETAAFLSTPEENSFDFNSFDSVIFTTETIQPNQKSGYSIDMVVSVNDISGIPLENNQYNEISPLGLNFNKGLISSTPLFMEMPPNIGNNIDISRAYILDSDFESGLFESSDWESGYHVNYNNDVNITRFDSPIDNIGGYYNIEVVGTNSIAVDINNNPSFKEATEFCFPTGEIVYLNQVDYISTTGSVLTLGDTYKIIDVIGNQLILEEVGTSIIQNLAPGGTYSTIGAENRWGYLYKAKFDNSKIKSGVFRRSYIKRSFIENENYDLTDIEFTRTRRLKRLTISDSIFRNTENIFSKGIYLNSSFVDGNDQFKNGIVYKSIWNGLTFSNGVFKESRWIDGVFENGLFYNNRSFDGNSNTNYPFYYNDRIKSYYKNGETSTTISNNRYSWQNGEFNGGEFYKSDWEGGNFNNGQLYFSKFYDGVINGGIIGDDKIQTENTIVYNGDINFTTVNNAVFYSSNNFSGVSSSTINWYDGVFNKGSFGSSIETGTYSATWYDGIFNGGDFRSMAKWKTGIFNGGNFISGFGWTMSDSTDILDYSWEDGVFNGGNFGNFNGLTNSTWYKGQFNGGVFTGRVWNNGIFTNGEFEGSAGTYSAIGGFTSSNANEFVLSFSSSYYGIWRDGFFAVEKDKFIKDKKIFTDRKSKKLLKKNEKTTISNALWLGGTFSHGDGEMVNSVWLDGAFEKGKFIKSSFNPYVITDHLFMNNRPTYSTQSFNFDDSSCKWYNGALEHGDFYYSEWEKGTYTHGTAWGMIWKDGVVNYMNAYNVFWENGLWKNGNWQGSFFDFNGEITDPFVNDLINRGIEWNGTSSVHVWNIFIDEEPSNEIVIDAEAGTTSVFINIF